ncbi:MAG TPA: anti-sigma factor [Candidatus Angelobacter sp.]|jgi:hypothetical protein|nr:anti-sigma factor [Candidatus Angelobacter sp.]
MNDHPQYADSLALYAMEALDDPREIAELQAHLGTCGECRRELENLRADTVLLALSSVGPQPPQRSRERLMKAIAAEPRRAAEPRSRFVLGRQPRWLSLAPIGVALVLAVISIGMLRDILRLRNKNEKLQAQLSDTMRQNELAREVYSMLADSQAQRMNLVPVKAPSQPQIRTIYKPEKGHVLMLASGLHPAPDDKVYELWLLPMSGGDPIPAGTFRNDGMMMHSFDTAGIQAKGWAITMEPAPGGTKPQGAIMFAPPS